MTALRAIVLVAVAAAALLVASAASGQASQNEMKNFPMPPIRGYNAVKTFNYTGDSGYFLSPFFSCVGGGASSTDYRYVRYRGVSNRRLIVYGAWGTTKIPADACFHSHVSYGVWAHIELAIPWHGESSTTWFLAGGGGMSGVLNEQGQCVMRTENVHAGIDDRFGWGDEFEEFDFRNFSFVKELVLGVQANTHGWGTCNADGFVACREPGYLIAYTLP